MSKTSVEGCEVEADELTERVLPDGESRLEFLAGYAGTGARFFPLPSTLPPPSFLADMFSKYLEPHNVEQRRSEAFAPACNQLGVRLNFGPVNIAAIKSIIRGLTTFTLSLSIMPGEFPAVEGGGSLILAWQIKNKNVLVVGGGEVSQSSIPSFNATT